MARLRSPPSKVRVPRLACLLPCLLLAGAAAPLGAQDPAPAGGAAVQNAAAQDAYLDPGARELVRLARERRASVDRSIEAYETTATERLSVGLRAVWRERLLWQREVATRIAWEREGPVRIEVLGARDVAPMFTTEPHMPGLIGGWVPRLAFDPADPYLLTGWGAGEGDVPHPLAAGGEEHYRYRSGDTTVISLPDGREVRLIELQVIPRRKAWDLLHGSFWLESRTHAVARVTVRPADFLDIERDRGEDVIDLIGPIRFSVEYVTIDYGLWELEWWLPRLFAIRGSATIGRLADLPFVFERRYGGYDVTGEPGSAEPLALEESPYAPGARVRCPTRAAFTVQIGGGRPDTTRADTAARPAPDTTVIAPVPTDTTLTEAQRRECERYTVVLTTDTASLLDSPSLPDDPFRYGEALLSETELEAIRERLEALGPPPVRVSGPRVTGPLGALGLLRYNRVEGLSLGLAGELDTGPARIEATARIGTADLEPRGELALVGEGPTRTWRFAAHRRLAAMDPLERPFSLGSSLQSLLGGLDETDFYDAYGVELGVAPAASRLRRWEARAYARRERPVDKETDVSLPGLFDGDRDFPAVRPAARATQVGAAATLRRVRGHDPLGLRLSAEVGAEAATGTFDWARAALTLRAGFPLPGRWVGALEGSAGTSAGHPAFQHLWRVGGPATLRGYPSGVAVGESFWRGRAEIGTQLPAFRLVLFSDAAWAGAFDDAGRDPWLLSAGAGISLLDGLARIDLARALRSPTGWRLTAYLDGWL